ncbi:MAG: hypothetical protein ACTHVE_12090 [Senegalia sp. (in: firmicutes)]|uniref:hypothetical protein n=1 Tax=Senegalia sp. (in: firmicutes) TaxID=1924098 RepID=UPI003F9DDD2A
MSEYISVKKTRRSYCQSCGKDFKDKEFVFYAPIDNNIVCVKCSEVHKDREPRIYDKEY